MSKRDASQAELNWGPKQLNEASSSAYRSYRIDGIHGMDPGTFLDKVKAFLVKLMLGEINLLQFECKLQFGLDLPRMELK